MIRRPPRSTLSSSSAASDVYKRQSKYSFHDMSIHEPVTVQRDELSDWLLATSDDERLPLIHGAENPRTVVAQLPLADDATHDPNVATCATDVEVMPPERLDKASVQQTPAQPAAVPYWPVDTGCARALR